MMTMTTTMMAAVHNAITVRWLDSNCCICYTSTRSSATAQGGWWWCYTSNVTHGRLLLCQSMRYIRLPI